MLSVLWVLLGALFFLLLLMFGCCCFLIILGSLHSRRSLLWEQTPCNPDVDHYTKAPEKVLRARERDADKGLENLSIYSVSAQVFQNARFSTGIYSENPAADHTA